MFEDMIAMTQAEKTAVTKHNRKCYGSVRGSHLSQTVRSLSTSNVHTQHKTSELDSVLKDECNKKWAMSQKRIHLAKDIRSNRKSFHIYVILKRNTNVISFFFSYATRRGQEDLGGCDVLFTSVFVNYLKEITT